MSATFAWNPVWRRNSSSAEAGLIAILPKPSQPGLWLYKHVHVHAPPFNCPSWEDSRAHLNEGLAWPHWLWLRLQPVPIDFLCYLQSYALYYRADTWTVLKPSTSQLLSQGFFMITDMPCDSDNYNLLVIILNSQKRIRISAVYSNPQAFSYLIQSVEMFLKLYILRSFQLNTQLCRTQQKSRVQ